MVNLVLSTGGFYFSRSFDLSHSVQWLVDNTTPMFKQLPMMGRVSDFILLLLATLDLCGPTSPCTRSRKTTDFYQVF